MLSNSKVKHASKTSLVIYKVNVRQYKKVNSTSQKTNKQTNSSHVNLKKVLGNCKAKYACRMLLKIYREGILG